MEKLYFMEQHGDAVRRFLFNLERSALEEKHLLLGSTIFLVIAELDLCDAHVLRFILRETCRIISVSSRTLFVKVCDVMYSLHLCYCMRPFSLQIGCVDDG